MDVEAERLRAVYRLGLLDTPPEERFDRVVRLAQRLFDVPMAAVNLVDDHRVWSKAGVGLPVRELPRSATVCSRVVAEDGPVVVPDLRLDAQFADHPIVADDGGLRFYAGAVLHAPSGQPVGTLCVMDREPRDVADRDVELLHDLARWVEKELAMDEELGAAAEVQRRLLPARAPDVPGYELAGACLPARDVGGDFYDWYEAKGGLQVVLGDVMGKGISAALIATSIKAVLRGASRFNDLPEAVNRTGFIVERDLEETGSFVTAFCARLEPESGTLSYVDAGHGLALIFDTEGRARLLRSGGLPLGTVSRDSWEAGSDRLAPGDTMLIVSDGLLDYFDDPAEAVEAARMISWEAPDATSMVRHVADLAAAATHTDDVTLLVLRRKAAA